MLTRISYKLNIFPRFVSAVLTRFSADICFLVALSFTRLEKVNFFTTRERNLQKLAIEMYKVINHKSPMFMQAIFPTVEKTYDLRNNRTFKGENVRTTLYGTESLKYLGPKNMGTSTS